MRELMINECEIVGGGLSPGDQIQGGTVLGTAGSFGAVEAAAAGSVLGVTVSLIAIGTGSFLIADAIINDGELLNQFQKAVRAYGEDDGDS